jgi:hypothetical protein
MAFSAPVVAYADGSVVTDAGPWLQLKGSEGCVTATDRDKADIVPCADVSDPLVTAALAQQFREVDMPSAPFGVAESLAFPGMCVIVDTDGQPDACACADLALAVRSMLATHCMPCGLCAMR